MASVEEWIEVVKDAERRGELLGAVDLAEQGLAEFPDSLALKHRAVLALARAGATDEAARRFALHGLTELDDEDVAALGARIVKDLALAAHGDARRDLARRARDRYAAIHGRTGGYYPAINAATLSLVAGEGDRARELAAGALALVRDDDSYYGLATAGEARLLLGDQPAAHAALTAAAARVDGDFGALATTRRQLRLVGELTGADPAVLDVLAGPGVVHYCGHRIAAPGVEGRFPAAAEAAVAERIAAAVARARPGYAYGALASGADIMSAEALLGAGAELHAVLPFARDEFVARSVASSGEGWVARFERCLDAAKSVTFATDDAFLGDDVLYRYGSELAMGLALLRARYLDADARQLAVWDEGPAHGESGTAIDVATWRRRGGETTVIGTGMAPAPASARGAASASGGGRVVRAMLFGDIKGFSKLRDEQLPVFAELVLGAFADTLRQLGDGVLHRNTWGDALYVVVTDAVEGATVALALQEAMAALDLDAAGLPADMALRLGAHIGPVFPLTDPVLEAPGFMGSHVSRTARIEPVTPSGEVYVTAPFAAALEVAGGHPFLCDYVGHMPAAKHYGRLRMYRLHHR